MLLKGQRGRIRKEKGWRVNQMWTKGGQDGRSCIDVGTLKIQKSGRISGSRSLAYAQGTPGVLVMEACAGRKGGRSQPFLSTY